MKDGAQILIDLFAAFVGFTLAWGGNTDFKRMKSALQRAGEHPSIIKLPKERRTTQDY